MDILGIDIGGSGIKGAPVDLNQGVLVAERLRIATPQPATPDAVADTVGRIIRHFNWTGPVGCGLPSVVQNGVARTAANIDSSWIGTDVRTLLSQRTGCPVTVINDADAAGIAEMRFGAGRGRNGTILMVTVGTGLGTALFRNGTLVPNTELGHLLLNGKVAEKYASAAAREDLGLSYETWAKRLDLYLHQLQSLFWPDLFILGGGISKKHEKFFPFLTIDTEFLPAVLRNQAGIVGAALAARG
ncbi:MAG: ROK family protein [Deltaproteobacteria bacterium]|jgi:polyphosphate glucokinase|nr:ROK family protein [Deltaproteobacteria bacterium]